MTTQVHDAVCLFDLDGTCADFNHGMETSMTAIMSPEERDAFDRLSEDDRAAFYYNDDAHWGARRKLIKSVPGFWSGLRPIYAGLRVYNAAESLGFEMHVLTQGPKANSRAWTEKVDWCAQYLPTAHVTITRKKSLSYGKVLVDDWPKYFMPWLEVRPRGLVVAIAQPWNTDVQHPRVVLYDGLNHIELCARLEEARESVRREPG